jgi:quercetin dioxygenase-like cupin family protein
MKQLLVLVPFIFGLARAADTSSVTPLLLKELPDFPGKEALVFTVDYPPGGQNPVHRHNAHAFIYVLEGSVVMQLQGGEPLTLTPGQVFYEGPADLHIVGRNASATKPAKLLVVLVKEKGADVILPP